MEKTYEEIRKDLNINDFKSVKKTFELHSDDYDLKGRIHDAIV